VYFKIPVAHIEDQIGLITDFDLSAEYQRITVAAVGALQMAKIPIAQAAVEVFTEARGAGLDGLLRIDAGAVRVRVSW